MHGTTGSTRGLGGAVAWVAVAALLGPLGCGGGGSDPDPGPTDTTAPTVLDSTPSPDATGVATTVEVSLLFSEPMDTTSVEGAFTLTGPSGAVAGAMSWDPGDAEARFTPAVPLSPGQHFTATVGTGARDAAGNPLAAPFTFAFDTAPVPEIVDALPLEGWTGVATTVEIRVSFGAVMDTTSLAAAFTLTTGGGAPIAGTFRFTGNEWSGTDLYFKPTARLVPFTTYDAVVSTAAMDAGGTHLANAWHLAFTTGAAPQRTLTVHNSPASYWLNAYGRVVDDLGRIDCGGDRTECSASYDEGTVVTLTAVAGPAADFTTWTGDDCSTFGAASTATVTLDVGRSCAATFAVRAGATSIVGVTLGPWIERVHELVGLGQTPRLDCGAAVVPSVCSYAFPAELAVTLKAVKDPAAPAGTLTWTCTPNDLHEPPTSPDLVFTGEASAPIWPNREKMCHVALVP